MLKELFSLSDVNQLIFIMETKLYAGNKLKLYTYAHTYRPTHTHTHTHIYIYIYIYTHARARPHKHAHTYRVELIYNVMKATEYFVSFQTTIVLNGFNVRVNSEELIVTTEHLTL